MPVQTAVTVRAQLLSGHLKDLDDVLREVKAQGGDGTLFPFQDLAGTHFARLFVLPGFTDPGGHVVPDSLLYLADVDGAAAAHLRDLAARAAKGLDAAFGHCAGYPEAPTTESRAAWLQSRALRPAAYYRHRIGRTVAQVRGEAALHRELAVVADDLAPLPGTDPVAVRRSLLCALSARPGWAWATRRARGIGVAARLREVTHAAVLPVVVVALLPVLLPVAVAGLVAIRVKEQRDRAQSGPADPEHVAAVEEHEDLITQNAFTAAGLVKPGLVRRATMRVALLGLDYASRHVFDRDQLAGVRTIHFARWQPLDDGERLLFASSYDGSQESYMDDFINRLSWGVNLVFSNGVGYPRTRWLVFGGARDEVSYKQYLRKHQIPTTVFWSAYADLPATAIDTNSRVRDGVARALSADDAGAWLRAI